MFLLAKKHKQKPILSNTLISEAKDCEIRADGDENGRDWFNEADNGADEHIHESYALDGGLINEERYGCPIHDNGHDGKNETPITDRLISRTMTICLVVAEFDISHQTA